MARVLSAVTAIVLAAVALSACGGGKPPYCSSVNDLKKSVADLASLNILESGASGLTAQLRKIENNAKKVVSDAANDFPSQADAIIRSVQALMNSINQVASAPTPAALGSVAQEIGTTATSVKNFVDATSSKCG